MARRTVASTATILSTHSSPTYPRHSSHHANPPTLNPSSHHVQSQQRPVPPIAEVAGGARPAPPHIDDGGYGLNGFASKRLQGEARQDDEVEAEAEEYDIEVGWEQEEEECGSSNSSGCEGDEGEREERVQVVQIPYKVLILRYALIVPPLALICFLGLVALVVFGWPPSVESALPYPHPPNLSLLLVGLAFFSLAHSLRLPCYSLISLLTLPPRTHHPSSSSSFPPVSSSSSSSTSPYLAPLSTALHTLSLELIRFASIVIVIPSLKPHPHPHGDGGDGNESVYPDVWLQWQSFGAAYWLGLGWALGEVGIGVWQGYQQLTYYSPILPPNYPSQSAFSLPISSSSFSHTLHPSYQPYNHHQQISHSHFHHPHPDRARQRSVSKPPGPRSSDPYSPSHSTKRDSSRDKNDSGATITRFTPSHHGGETLTEPTSDAISRVEVNSLEPIPDSPLDASSSSSSSRSSSLTPPASPRTQLLHPTHQTTTSSHPSQLNPSPPSPPSSSSFSIPSSPSSENEELELDRQIWNLIAVQRRESVEDVLGVPLPNVPAIVSALWRIDGLVLNLGVTLIMSSIYTSYLSLSTPPRSSLSLALLFLELTILALAHAAISVFWVVGMKRLGAPTTTYASFLVALGGFIWGLGCWRGLV